MFDFNRQFFCDAVTSGSASSHNTIVPCIIVILFLVLGFVFVLGKKADVKKLNFSDIDLSEEETEKIKKYKELLDDGIITQEEFEAVVRKVLKQ